MFYKSYPRKVLKFKDLYKENYEVDVCYDDMVIDIKKRLSINIKKDYKNILFMFKNEILFDDKLISDYNIERSQFVLWFEGEDCVRYSGGNLDIIKCITIIDNHNNDYEYFVNMNKLSTVRMLKSIIANKYGLNKEEFYLEFNKNNLSIDENCKSLEQFGLSDGCKIDLFYRDIIKLIINNKYLNKSGEILAINLSKYSTIYRLKQICAEKTNIKLNEISLRFNEKCLFNDDAILDRYGLIDGCNIDLIGGNIMMLYVKYFGNQGQICSICVNVDKYLTVDKLRQLISEKSGINLENVELEYWGSEMHDKDRLSDYEIDDGDVLTMNISLDRRAGGGHTFYKVSVIALTEGYESFRKRIHDVNDLINEICEKYRIIDSFINLYSDANKINQIRNDRDFQDLYNNNNDHHGKQIKIYYEIISKLVEFEVIAKLGQGSFGKVYKYKNKNTNQIFAMKKFDLSVDLLTKENFQKEVNFYLSLKFHPRIIKYIDHFIENQKSYILMEYMIGGSLVDFVKNNDPLPEYKIAKYAHQILEGLEYLHDNKVLHRDLKGDNILLDENYDLKLCDFGLAKILRDISSGEFLNGVVQSTVGTMNWMSPEITNGDKYGVASDIWSFGATMVEIITRKRPYEGLAIGIIVKDILAGELKFEYPANSSEDMKSFVNSCLKRNPNERSTQRVY